MSFARFTKKEQAAAKIPTTNSEIIMSQRRVVITGLGQVSPVGNDVATAWSNLLAGKSGIGRIYPLTHPTSTANRRRSTRFRHQPIHQRKEARQYGRVHPLWYRRRSASHQRFRLGRFETLDKDRVGVNIGSGIGGLPSIEATGKAIIERRRAQNQSFLYPRLADQPDFRPCNHPQRLPRPELRHGVCLYDRRTPIGDSARLIKYGDADVMIAGGAEGAISTLGVGGFAAMKALSTRNDDPATASRPWDKGRDGFVIGEGAGVLVLEELEHAKNAVAKIYAEIVGFGMSSDAYHITAPNEEGPALAVTRALKDAGLNPEDVDYVNAHGTSTPLGDANETKALKPRFGRPCPQSHRQFHQIP